MAGVLFIIWIPCERYEQVLSDKSIWEPSTPVNVPKSSFDGNKQNGKESKPSSLETFTVSIESDSLNQDDKGQQADKKKHLKRTKSADDVSDDILDDRSREKRDSMDSDEYIRMQKQRARMKANEEAVDRFFGADLQGSPLDEMSSMERVMRDILERFRIRNSSWVRVNSGNTYQITFSLENGVRCDDTIHMLSEFGIGQKDGSSIAIVPCTLYSDHHKVKDEGETSSTQSAIKETAWNKFIGTVRARMNVAKIVEAVKTDATLTFDFVVLLIVASILASFGLVENSTLFLAASMLISPLMGPILAATFGAVIKDHKLQYWGLANEIIGIFLCISVGFVFGLISCGLDYSFGTEKALTPEMLTRTDLHSVVVGVFIALPSGAAVAIAVLGENFGSLVGVAISASLLPPAVNTGLMWSLSCIHLMFKNYVPRFERFVAERKYSDDEALELLSRGCVSLCVTLTNCLCIYFMGFIFLKMKEVAPASDNQRQFWKHDIKIARDYNKTVNADEGRKLQEDLSQFHENASENFKGVGAELLRLNNYPHTNTWSPLTLRNHRKDVQNTRTSLRDLDSLYTSFSGKHSLTEKHHRIFPFNRGGSPPHETLQETVRGRPHNPSLSSPKHDYSRHSSALDVITEMPTKIHHESTFVSIEGRPGPSGVNPRKFTVTPAADPLM